MKVMNSDKLSPYGEITWMDKKDVERLIYVYRIQHEAEDFRPPSAWFVNTAFGDRLYLKARSRADAQRICDCLFECSGKYKVIPDKVGSIR